MKAESRIRSLSDVNSVAEHGCVEIYLDVCVYIRDVYVDHQGAKLTFL